SCDLRLPLPFLPPVAALHAWKNPHNLPLAFQGAVDISSSSACKRRRGPVTSHLRKSLRFASESRRARRRCEGWILDCRQGRAREHATPVGRAVQTCHPLTPPPPPPQGGRGGGGGGRGARGCPRGRVR